MSESNFGREPMSRRRRLQAQGVQSIIEGLQQREKPFVADLGETAIAESLRDPDYHPAQAIVEDTQVGFDLNGDWHTPPLNRWDDNFTVDL